MNQIEALEVAQRQGILSLAVTVVNPGFYFSPASYEALSPESQAIFVLPALPQTSSPARVGVPARNLGLSPVSTVTGPVSYTPVGLVRPPTQGGKQPRRRTPGGDGGCGGNPSNGGDTPRSRRSGVPSDQRDLQDAFEQMSDRQRERLQKKNVQSVTKTNIITTVYKDG